MRPAFRYERATGNQTHISKACCCYTNYQRPLRAERAVDDLLALPSTCSSAGKFLLVLIGPGAPKAQRGSTRPPMKSARQIFVHVVFPGATKGFQNVAAPLHMSEALGIYDIDDSAPPSKTKNNARNEG